MARFGAQTPNGLAVQQLEVLVRTALFKPANALVQWLLQQAADRVDAAYQPAPGQQRKGRACLRVDGLFGTFPLERDYYYHEGKKTGALSSRCGPGPGGGLHARFGAADLFGGRR